MHSTAAQRATSRRRLNKAVKTPSGLVYEVVQPGTGAVAKPATVPPALDGRTFDPAFIRPEANRHHDIELVGILN